jgi:hypothetical protein
LDQHHSRRLDVLLGGDSRDRYPCSGNFQSSAGHREGTMSAVVEFGHRTQIVARLKHALLAFWVPLVLAALVPTIVTVVASRFDGPVSKPLPSLLPPNDILSPPAVPVETTPLAAQQPLATLDGMFWDSIKTSNNPADFKAYLTRFPNGMFVELAQNRLAILERDTVPSPKPLSDGLASGSSVWPDRDETAGMIERARALDHRRRYPCRAHYSATRV